MLVSALPNLLGKQIRWYAPSSKYNQNYTGVAIITSVNLEERRPITSETVDGDELDYAFNDDMDDVDGEAVISYSDSYRNVSFEILD